MNVPAKISERPAAGSAEEWRGIAEDFEREGTTAAAQCEGRRTAPKTPLRRRRRFAREADPAPAFASLGPAPVDPVDWDAELDLGGGMVPRLRRHECRRTFRRAASGYRPPRPTCASRSTASPGRFATVSARTPPRAAGAYL